MLIGGSRRTGTRGVRILRLVAGFFMPAAFLGSRRLIRFRVVVLCIRIVVLLRTGVWITVLLAVGCVRDGQTRKGKREQQC